MALSVGFRITVSLLILLPKLRGSDSYPGGTVSHRTRQPSLDAQRPVSGRLFGARSGSLPTMIKRHARMRGCEFGVAVSAHKIEIAAAPRNWRANSTRQRRRDYLPEHDTRMSDAIPQPASLGCRQRRHRRESRPPRCLRFERKCGGERNKSVTLGSR
jgi:hypothetical protein